MSRPACPGSGSSPLARGTPGESRSTRFVEGLIPARAGNTLNGATGTDPSGAHPRSRGEHRFDCYGEQGVGGSSPLARGTHAAILRDLEREGLIPARAGNPCKFCVTVQVIRAHPRSRGEHVVEAHNTALESGSSPLARGTPFGNRGCDDARGLIPARAGNTGCEHDAEPAVWAHPRSRGEH